MSLMETKGHEEGGNSHCDCWSSRRERGGCAKRRGQVGERTIMGIDLDVWQGYQANKVRQTSNTRKLATRCRRASSA
jgi:hypothetical protein